MNLNDNNPISRATHRLEQQRSCDRCRPPDEQAGLRRPDHRLHPRRHHLRDADRQPVVRLEPRRLEPVGRHRLLHRRPPRDPGWNHPVHHERQAGALATRLQPRRGTLRPDARTDRRALHARQRRQGRRDHHRPGGGARPGRHLHPGEPGEVRRLAVHRPDRPHPRLLHRAGARTLRSRRGERHAGPGLDRRGALRSHRRLRHEPRHAGAADAGQGDRLCRRAVHGHREHLHPAAVTARPDQVVELIIPVASELSPATTL